MPAPLLHVETQSTLPADADAVVIGAGIVGICAGFFLAERGLKVAVIEKGRVGAEQSSRNWGWCRQQNRDARELPMATKSLALWEHLTRATNQDLGFRRCGLLYLSNDTTEIETWARWCRFARDLGVTSNPLDATAATERGAFTGKAWKGGVFSPDDGIANPERAAPLIAQALAARGGVVMQNCAARGLELEGGRVAGVITEHGTIRTRVAVLAAGAWASSFCRQYGIRFPQASIRSSILSIAPGAELPDAVHTSEVSITRRGSGGHTLAISGHARVDPTPQQLRFATSFMPMFFKRRKALAPGGIEGWLSGHETLSRWALDRPTPMEKRRILDPKVDSRQIDLTLARASKLFPRIERFPVTARWAGYVDSTPDGVPAIGETDEVPGLILAAGFSGHGFGIGPGAGKLIADLVTGEAPIVDPKPYHPSRFNSAAWGKVAEF
ncbi:MAG: FAD-binding oxidoreductase [Beijerinckiaceae bacterium]|nr:FAD-binding oxidoreductase [Beijerinckiaceae bacterium]